MGLVGWIAQRLRSGKRVFKNNCSNLNYSKEKYKFTNKHIYLKLRKKQVKCHICSMALYGAEAWTLREIIRNTLGFEMCCRNMKISWTDRVKKKSHRAKDERNILHTTNRKKVNWIGHILRRKCLLKHVTEANIQGRGEVTRRRGRRGKQLQGDLKEAQDTRNWKWKLYISVSQPPGHERLSWNLSF